MSVQSNIKSNDYTSGLQIPALDHEEAYKMAIAELDIFLAFLTSLSAEDWQKPTLCSLWNVREMVAHINGAQEGYLAFKNFKRQMVSKELKRFAVQGLKNIDATNQLQVEDRTNHTPDELISELREIGPTAIYNRYKLPLALRAMRLYLPVFGLFRIDYLTDLIYTRDMWMHRLDICKATARPMSLTSEHDGRITALAVRDLAKRLPNKLKGTSVGFSLTGVAGGKWRIGQSAFPVASLEMDALDFHLLAAGRYSAKQMIEQKLVTIENDTEVGLLALEKTQIPY
jgi:uncharacterized protein (TIGR03083 family)